MSFKPLQVSVVWAGKLLGMDSEVTARKNVPEILPTIRAGGQTLVPVSALANKLGCTFDHIWQAVAVLEEQWKADAPARSAKAAAARAAAAKRNAELIDKRVDGMPAVVAIARAAAKGAA